MTQQPGGAGWPGSPPPGSNPAQPWASGPGQPTPYGQQPPPGWTPSPPWGPAAPQQNPAYQPPQGPPPGQPWQHPGQPAQYPGQPSQYPGPPQQHPASPAVTKPAPDRSRDPRQSFAEPPPEAVHIESFAPPKARTSTVVTVVAGVALILIVLAGLFLRSGAATPSPSPTPTPPPPSPTVTLPGQPFRSPGGTAGGRWQIVSSRWTDEGLSAQIEITADDGPVTYSFMAFANAGTDVLDPTQGPDVPELDRGTLRDDETIRGWVFFPAPRGDTTIILATSAGRQMSALVVKG